MSSPQDPTLPQRPRPDLDPGTGWVRLSPWAALPTALSLLKPRVLATAAPGLVALTVVFGELLISGRWGVLGAVLIGTVVVLAATAVWALLWWQRFRYRVDPDGITVRSGILHRSEVRLGWDRVRNVDLSQAFYLRPVDRVTLVLEGTGGSEEVVSIPAVTRDIAEDVRRRAVAVPTVGEADPATDRDDADPAQAQEVMHQPSPGALLLHGAINGRAFALLLAGLGVLYSVLTPFVDEVDLVQDAADRLRAPGIDTIGGWLLVAVPVLVVISALLVAISAVAALVISWGYRLTLDRDRYVFSYGLVETHQRSLRTVKLQALTTVETAVGRLLGRAHVLVHKATSSTGDEGDEGDGSLLVPAMSRAEAAALVRRLDPAASPRPQLTAIARAFRRFWMQRLAALELAVLAAALLAAWWLDGDDTITFVVVAVLAALAMVVTPVLVAVTWRNWGWALDGSVLFITSGLLGRRHEVFRLDRVQHVAVTRSPYQRRNGLADLKLALPDGERAIPFLDHATAVLLADRALIEVETAAHLEL